MDCFLVRAFFFQLLWMLLARQQFLYGNRPGDNGNNQRLQGLEKLFVGPDMFYCGLPERERVFTLAYTNREGI